MDRPTLLIGNLIQTLIISGAILIGAILIAPIVSIGMNIALVALLVGFFAHIVAAQLLVSVKMEKSQRNEDQQARSSTVAVAFTVGWLSYVVAVVCLIVSVF